MPSPAPVLGWLKKESSPFDWEDDAALRYVTVSSFNTPSLPGTMSACTLTFGFVTFGLG